MGYADMQLPVCGYHVSCGSDMCGYKVCDFVVFRDQAPSSVFLFSHPISLGIGY